LGFGISDCFDWELGIADFGFKEKKKVNHGMTRKVTEKEK